MVTLPTPEGAGGADVLEVAGAQELGADDADERGPREEGDEQGQQPEVHREDRREDDDDVEARHVGPDLDDPLEEEVDPAAEKALAGAGDDADHARDRRDDEGEEHRDAEAVDHPGEDVAGLVVGAEPVQAVGSRGRADHVVVDGVEAEADRRPDRPARVLDRRAVDGARRHRLIVDALRVVETGFEAAGPDQAADLGGGVFGLGGEFAAEVGLGVEGEDREAPRALKADDEGAVVGDELGEERDQEDREEHPQRPEGPAVRLEVGEAAALEGVQAHRGFLAAGRAGDCWRGALTPNGSCPVVHAARLSERWGAGFRPSTKSGCVRPPQGGRKRVRGAATSGFGSRR